MKNWGEMQEKTLFLRARGLAKASGFFYLYLTMLATVKKISAPLKGTLAVKGTTKPSKKDPWALFNQSLTEFPSDFMAGGRNQPMLIPMP
jgi:hypothetical protein